MAEEVMGYAPYTLYVPPKREHFPTYNGVRRKGCRRWIKDAILHNDKKLANCLPRKK